MTRLKTITLIMVNKMQLKNTEPKMPKILGNRSALEAENLLRSEIKRDLLPLCCAFIGASFGMIALFGYLHASSQLSVVPYVITVDKSGAVIARDDLQGSNTIPERALASDLIDFIENLRRKTSDQNLFVNSVHKVFARLKDGSQALEEVQRFYTGQKQDRSEINAQVNSILRVSEKVFQVDWCEGKEQRCDACFRARITYELSAPGQDLSALKLNPLGIKIHDLRLSPRALPPVPQAFG